MDTGPDLGAPVPASPEALGGRYHLRELLGVGGSAAVFRAVDPGDGSPVAVKILHPHLCDTRDARDAFLREAELAGGLRHPHIARVLGSGLHESGGVTQAWIALEALAGGSLADHVAQAGPLAVEDAIDVMSAVADALATAHAAGLVHRDVSPSNILLRAPASGRRIDASDVCLVDFGLADLAGRDTTGGDVLRITRGSGVVGNAHYLSPEQALGRPVTAAGDIYQAGAVLYFLVTGRPPYPRDDRALTAQAHVSAPPPVPSAIAPAARSLDRVVTRAMAKRPEDRYPDAAAFRAGLLAARHPGVRAGADAPDRTEVTRLLPSGGLVPRASGAGHPRPTLRPAATPPAPARRAGGAVAALVLATLLIGGIVAVAAAWLPPSPAPAAEEAQPVQSAPVPESSPSPTDTASAPQTATPPPASDPSPTPVVVVPSLEGTLEVAEALLARTGLSAGSVTRVESPRAAGQVLEQRPAAGETLAPGSAVDLTIASGRNRVPDVSGLDVASAVVALQSAGFTAAATAGSAGDTVTATVPALGTVTSLGTRIELRIEAPSATPEPTPTPAADDPRPLPMQKGGAR